MRLRHEARHVDQADGDEPDSVEAVLARDAHLPAGAGGPRVCDAVVGVDRRERIVGDLCLGQGRRPEECRFAAVGFSCNGQCDHEQLLLYCTVRRESSVGLCTIYGLCAGDLPFAGTGDLSVARDPAHCTASLENHVPTPERGIQ